MIVLHSDLFPAWKLFENEWNEGEKHSHHLRNSHSRVLKGFLSDLPSLPRKGIVTVTTQRRVLQQENHMGCKIKISITGEESRQQRSAYIELLFSPCLLGKVGNALSLQRWCCEMSNAHGRVAKHLHSTMSFLGSARSSDSPVTSWLQWPESCSSLAKQSPIWPSAHLPAPGIAQEGRLHPQQGQEGGQVTPPAKLTAPCSPTSKQSSVSTARPVDPIKGRGDFLLPQASMATLVAFCSTAQVSAGLVLCVRASAGEHEADTNTQPRVWIVPGDNLSQTCQAGGDPGRNQVGFLQAQSTVFLNGRLCSSNSPPSSYSAFLPSCSNSGQQPSLLFTLFG